ncbi:hypothetical protein EUTSA_v10007250mg [Eutrema salsugineum]|uniref:Zinc finger PHD-type domain-containing protein n=1 Tax=Eutrema salsugineum TaxID=72664 RepID=V4KPY4_EUTSA|nr:uncharacterized protein LOC18991650 [Eutrema salsugineum]ESQ33384.1 hypothetical protein EUTSA_v10007250mg [Eutrema salsugineum]
MDSIGEFHEVEKDGKLFQVYHHPILQTQSPINSSPGEAASNNQPHQLFFLCPNIRWQDVYYNSEFNIVPLEISPECKQGENEVLPLFFCNNKEFDVNGGCEVCRGSRFGTDYYFCVHCDQIYHKECVKSPLKIKHPYHPEHPLQLYYHVHYGRVDVIECLCCARGVSYLVYHCTICQIFMHPICAMKSVPFVIEKPKRHDHPLTSFPRPACLTCDVCGLVRKLHPTYVCLRCNFVAHNDCLSSPRVIKISRHQHRISYVPCLPSGEWSCGVCRQSVDGNYGAYTCAQCGNYAVHPRCALRKDVCDGEELEGVEEDDITQDLEPFVMISDGVILHFLHDHPLRLEVNILYDENKLCQACVMPIFEEKFYSCMDCDFILHESCTNAPRRMQHALHPHILTLKAVSRYPNGLYNCDACARDCDGFIYECPKLECDYGVDVRCSSLSEPFDFKGHEHPLFLALDPRENPICQVCESICASQLNCIKCNFIVCIKCATLPYKAKYKHDKHLLEILWGDEVCEKDWCELCERNLGDTGTKIFYWCNDCCTTLHIECLFGDDPYVKPRQ